jgi:predicted alpha/beta-hydrolase family hydrolase
VPPTAAAPVAALVPTPAGDARVTTHAARGRALGLLVLGHGAGGGIEAPDLRALAAALPPQGIGVALVEQPWRVAGRKLAPAPGTLDAAWLPVMAGLAASVRVPLLVGGRSAGARVACRTAAATGAAGVLALAFPLHPPGRPDRSRADELLGTGLPTLTVQGAKDPFGAPGEFPELPPGHRLLALSHGNHSFAVPKSAPLTGEELLAQITGEVGRWALELLAQR